MVSRLDSYHHVARPSFKMYEKSNSKNKDKFITNDRIKKPASVTCPSAPPRFLCLVFTCITSLLC